MTVTVSVKMGQPIRGATLQPVVEATTTYRQAKKDQTDSAARLGNLRAEIKQLRDRIARRAEEGGDIAPLEVSLKRISAQVAMGEAALGTATEAFRVAHVNLLMQDHTLTHYREAVRKQLRLAQMSEDENQEAIHADMQGTLDLISELVMGRAAAVFAREIQARDGATPGIQSLFDRADSEPIGAYLDGDQTVLPLVHEGDGIISTARGPLGRIPFSYERGVVFADGYLALNSRWYVAPRVTAREHTGYLAAYSILVED